MQKILFLIVFVLIQNSSFANLVQESVIITDRRPDILKILKGRTEFTIDHVKPYQFELHGPKGTIDFLNKNNVQFFREEIPHSFAAQYPTPEEIEKKLKDLNKKYPELTQLYSIGKSVKKRDLWVMKITSPLNTNKDKPKFKYVGNMHGDEIVGREILVLFIEDLLKNYATNSKIAALLDNTEIHILPSMNPDGAAASSRGNGNYVDLNRDFPDFSTSDNQDTLNNRQPETKAVMQWQNKYRFKLSANFHGGAEVVNYPWDTSPEPCPQFDLVKDISLEYAENAPYLRNSTTFDNGITNGFTWYEVNGGMQDWSIYWRKDLQLTIELSNIKWPDYSQVAYYYDQNRESLIRLIERIHTF